jgi:MFS family permease
LGYAIGALLAGIIADRFGFSAAILSIGGITFISGAVVAVAMRGHDQAGRVTAATQRV